MKNIKVNSPLPKHKPSVSKDEEGLQQMFGC